MRTSDPETLLSGSVELKILEPSDAAIPAEQERNLECETAL